VEEERSIEGKDFLKIKEAMVDFLQRELRQTKNFGVFNEQSGKARQQSIENLEGVINSLKRGQLSLAREYFAALVGRKERAALQMARDLREAIAAAKPKVDKLNKESARLLGELERAKREENFKRAQTILKEIGNIDDAIGRVGQGQEEIRQDLKRAQDDPDLNQFRSFVAAIDKELGKGR